MLKQSRPIVVANRRHVAFVIEPEFWNGLTAILWLLGCQVNSRSAADHSQQEGDIASVDDVHAV
jgi:hypothetical protein